LPATIFVDANGVLNILGTDDANTCLVYVDDKETPDKSDDRCLAFAYTPDKELIWEMYDASQVKSILFLGLGGKCAVLNLSSLPAVVDGGGGNDFLSGGGGKCTVHGGLGDDSVMGGIGQDLLFGDEDDDTVVSVGGTQNDVLSGGPGFDT